MKRGREEKSHETSLSAARLRHGRISTGEVNIPLDLTVEILKKLPAKSLVRFQCVSKVWSSTISRRKDFIDSIVSRSLSQPPRDAHVILNPENDRESFLVISSSCPQIAHGESLSTLGKPLECVRGLFLCWSYVRQEGAIYNPTTRQSFYLPKMKPSRNGICFFGYDPLGDQYKVLFLPDPNVEQVCQVFTLGDPTAKQWRSIQGTESLFSSLGLGSEVSISGGIYFLARTYKLLSFDVRSDKFYHVDAPKALTLTNRDSSLITYQGKVGLMCCEQGVEIWVMEEDSEKKTQRWSKIIFYEMQGFEDCLLSDVTRDGEIVFTIGPNCMLRIIYYDPKRNSVRYVDLLDSYPMERRLNKFNMRTKKRRLNKSFLIWTFPDYVENTMFLY